MTFIEAPKSIMAEIVLPFPKLMGILYIPGSPRFGGSVVLVKTAEISLPKVTFSTGFTLFWFLIFVRFLMNLLNFGIFSRSVRRGMFTSHCLKVSYISLFFSIFRVSFKALGNGGRSLYLSVGGLFGILATSSHEGRSFCP